MFGPMDIPAKLVHEPLLLKTEYDKNTILYHRELDDEIVEKKIYLKRKKSFIINPVEPTNTPKPLSTHVLIEFNHPMVVEPQSDCTIFLTFPVEIGVFLSSKKRTQLIDVFSLQPHKLSLYGNPKDGIICKYWHSNVFLSTPQLSPFIEGVIELTIRNGTTEWHEITKTVFDSYLMKIFYNNEMVCLKGEMKISDKGMAETGFIKEPLIQGMKQSIEVYSLSKLNIMQTAFVMEYGL